MVTLKLNFVWKKNKSDNWFLVPKGCDWTHSDLASIHKFDKYEYAVFRDFTSNTPLKQGAVGTLKEAKKIIIDTLKAKGIL